MTKKQFRKILENNLTDIYLKEYGVDITTEDNGVYHIFEIIRGNKDSYKALLVLNTNNMEYVYKCNGTTFMTKKTTIEEVLENFSHLKYSKEKFIDEFPDTNSGCCELLRERTEEKVQVFSKKLRRKENWLDLFRAFLPSVVLYISYRGFKNTGNVSDLQCLFYTAIVFTIMPVILSIYDKEKLRKDHNTSNNFKRMEIKNMYKSLKEGSNNYKGTINPWRNRETGALVNVIGIARSGEYDYSVLYTCFESSYLINLSAFKEKFEETVDSQEIHDCFANIV